VRGKGFPVAAAETHDGVESQRFELGVVYWSQTGTFAVPLEVAKCADELGTWRPISASEDVGPSGVPGTSGTMQRFRDPSGVELVVYSSEHGVHGVAGGILAYYERLGGWESWLGFPLGRWQPLEGQGSLRWRQSFEGGNIYHRDGHDPLAVSCETQKLLDPSIGWPVTEERPIGADGPDRIQFFENGVVTLRDGKREVWPRQQ
jgi:uncharacterized protein with LGFP repeats